MPWKTSGPDSKNRRGPDQNNRKGPDFSYKKDKEADAAVSMLTLQCNIANNNNNAVDLLQDEEKWVYWKWRFI